MGTAPLRSFDRPCSTSDLTTVRGNAGGAFTVSQAKRLPLAGAVHPGRQRSSPRLISTGRLNALPHLHPRPINLVIYKESYQVNPVGDLILGPVSRLDAFSVYPLRTWLSSRATGATTGTPAVRPPRSSRTKGRTPQISCARGR